VSTTLLLVLLLLWPVGVNGQHLTSPQSVPVVPRTPLEREVQRALICMCGTCGRQRLSECPCGPAAAMRQEVAGLIQQGKTKDEILQYFIQKHGSQVPLAAPIDEGFNRLAWLFPYAVGVTGAIALALVTKRWSKRERETAVTTSGSEDVAMRSRLDDELRDLD
jgi:cytochrome c-type biogenesis protein CcmH/NrfF